METYEQYKKRRDTYREYKRRYKAEQQQLNFDVGFVFTHGLATGIALGFLWDSFWAGLIAFLILAFAPLMSKWAILGMLIVSVLVWAFTWAWAIIGTVIACGAALHFIEEG